MMQKRLYRSRTDRMLGGVAGGLGDYFNTDPAVIRLVFVLTCLFAFGTGFLFYLILWVILPANGQAYASAGQPIVSATAPRTTNGSRVIGLALIGLGGLFLLRNVFPWVFSFGTFWPLILITIGVVMLVSHIRK